MPYNSGFKSLDFASLQHPNSMRFKDNELQVVCLLHSKLRNNEKTQCTCIYRYSYPDMCLIGEERFPTAFHNLWEMNGGDWTLDSGNRLIRSLSGQGAVKLDDGGWLRGVAVTDDELIVGSSEMSCRLERKTKSGKVHVLDRNNQYKVKRTILLKGGNVNDIRVIGENDYSHDVKDVFHL